MRPLTTYAIAFVLFFASEALLAHYGYVRIYLILFIPVIESTSALAFAPILFFLFPLLYSVRAKREGYQRETIDYGLQGSAGEKPKAQSKIGGFVMIGPVPIVFGKGISGRALIVLALIMLILIVAWFILVQ